MSTASIPLGLNSYFTKWTGGYKSWKTAPTSDNKTVYGSYINNTGALENAANASAAPQGAVAGVTYNRPGADYLADVSGGWYPRSRPLKHHRKSHATHPQSGSAGTFVPATTMRNKAPVGTMDIPTNTVFSRDVGQQDCSSCGVYITSAYDTKESKQSVSYYQEGGQVQISTSDARNALAKVRNGSTNGSKYCNENQKYYSDTKGYLQARCNSFKKKSMVNQPLPAGTAGQAYHYPGTQSIPVLYNSGCNYTGTPSDPSGCCVSTVYKPANTAFSTNTAVSSSTRIARLKYDTVTKAAQGLKQKWGPEVANNATYSGLPSAPFTTKSKNNSNKCPGGTIAKENRRKTGNKTMCFYTPTNPLTTAHILSS
tara:strand:- start:2627 stop:3733 length:1107 start_codon:yes stop_codon:yes gene_type:complete